MISHWDDVEAVRRERGHICGDWQALTGDSSDWIGVQRIRIAPGQVVDAAPPRGRGRGDLLRPGRVGRQRAADRLDGRGLRGRAWRLPRPSGARARAHAAGGPRRARRPRVRRAKLRGQHAAPARGCLLARPDVGARGGARGPPVEARGERGTAGGRRARGAAVADRQRARRRAAGARRGDRRARVARPRSSSRVVQDRDQAPRGPPRQAQQPAALPQRRGGDLRRARRRGHGRALAAPPVQEESSRRTRSVGEQSSPGPAGNGASRTLSAPATAGSRSSRTERATRATSRTTRARGR